MSNLDLFIMRRSKGIKLRQVAEYCNCSISLISLYENQKTTMCNEKVKKYKKFIIDY
ncbi:MAG TPA: helix-turn-helix transcriptional regulator [Niallia sp.]|nr:helix-turn-helix transcriptional regulator [Niallia sp.]